MIDPSIWTDEGMAALTPRQQLLFIGLFSNADDEGRIRASPGALRLMLPTIYLDAEDPDGEVAADLDAVCSQIRQLQRYERDGREYLVFRSYQRWQRIDKPSKSALPAPNDRQFGTSSPNVSEDSMSLPSEVSEWEGIEEKEREEKLGEVSAAKSRRLDEPASNGTLHPHAPRSHSEGQISDLVAAYADRFPGGADEVRRRIDKCQNDVSYDRAKDKRKQVRSWLEQDLDWIREHGGTDVAADRKLSGANRGRGAAGQSAASARSRSSATVIDPSARDPRELERLRELGQL